MAAERSIKGKVVKLGDSVNTDVMSPGQYIQQGLDAVRLHTMEAIRVEFYRDVKPGNILLAGKNFGCGSHRESATAVMKHMGLSAIVADSVARLYFRNCIAFGIAAFSVEGVSRLFEEGDEMEIVMGEDKVAIRNVTRGGEVTGPPIPETMAKVWEAGGVYPLLKQKLAEGAAR
jgi:3-isopropylmalate/(R)-2-methylmalate dehydratase small subunit